MKRTIVIFVLIIIVISVAATTGNAIIIAETVPAKECAQSSAIDYLEQAAYSQWLMCLGGAEK